MKCDDWNPSPWSQWDIQVFCPRRAKLASERKQKTMLTTDDYIYQPIKGNQMSVEFFSSIMSVYVHSFKGLTQFAPLLTP